MGVSVTHKPRKLRGSNGLPPGSVYSASMFLGSASAMSVGQVLLKKPDFAM